MIADHTLIGRLCALYGDDTASLRRAVAERLYTAHNIRGDEARFAFILPAEKQRWLDRAERLLNRTTEKVS